ncbi:tRNA-guanine transglycosylase [Tothia fuscella]|uniref:Queuine tRNA-ribosyltransferase accessory subunit 2 n=1 Tax=Tothia fuscella TaxID=1048955 RepID=A0A9P4P3X7_9PEZI|nr:tRNA-guanine transglycosylase [Tothia fuscella]
MLTFTLAGASQRLAPRLGTLIAKGRTPIQTPHYIGNTSRGVIPHITHDNQRKHTAIRSLYMGLEDFIEKLPPRKPPIYDIPYENDISPLKVFASHPPSTLLILSPRRFPPVETPTANTNTTLSICTSVGFRSLPISQYIDATAKLHPDIVISPCDFVPPAAKQNASVKRVEKMSDRTAVWLRDMLAMKKEVREEQGSGGNNGISVFAPILPVEGERQRYYLDQLVEDFKGEVSGLVLYDCGSLGEIPESLEELPRLMLSDPANPRELLQQISLGADMFVLPFVSLATDAGIALGFVFPPPLLGKDGNGSTRVPLGLDTWNEENATDVGSLQEGCQCYACVKHHKAYLHHLLSAKEMLAWVLIQIHNHYVMDQFFAGVRSSIANGTFEEDRQAFERYYEAEMSEKTNQGPRVRGYQFKSKGGGEPKKNPKGYNKLDDMAESLAEAPVPSPSVDAGDLEEHGLGQVSKS